MFMQTRSKKDITFFVQCTILLPSSTMSSKDTIVCQGDIIRKKVKNTWLKI